MKEPATILHMCNHFLLKLPPPPLLFILEKTHTPQSPAVAADSMGGSSTLLHPLRLPYCRLNSSERLELT